MRATITRRVLLHENVHGQAPASHWAHFKASGYRRRHGGRMNRLVESRCDKRRVLCQSRLDDLAVAADLEHYRWLWRVLRRRIIEFPDPTPSGTPPARLVLLCYEMRLREGGARGHDVAPGQSRQVSELYGFDS